MNRCNSSKVKNEKADYVSKDKKLKAKKASKVAKTAKQIIKQNDDLNVDPKSQKEKILNMPVKKRLVKNSTKRKCADK